MQTLFYTALFCGFMASGFTQTQSLVGSWYWSDSTKQTSIFFKRSGSVLIHTGAKGEVILTKNLKEGTYTLKGNKLSLKWADGEMEYNDVKFLGEDVLRITFSDKKNRNQKRDYIFRKIVDEEVREE